MNFKGNYFEKAQREAIKNWILHGFALSFFEVVGSNSSWLHVELFRSSWILHGFTLSFFEVVAFKVHFDLPEGQEEGHNEM